MNIARVRRGAALVLALSILSLSGLPARVTPPVQITSPVEQPVQALFQLEQAAAQSGWTGEAAWQAGQVWKRLGNLSRAVAYWEIASRHAPDNADLWRALAESYITLQRWSLASVALTRTAELTPEDNWAHYHLGLLQAAASPQVAVDHLKQIASDSEYAAVVTDLLVVLASDDASMPAGLTLARHNLWNYAELAFQHTLTFSQPLPEASAYLGLVRDRQGKDGSAAIEQAVSLAPDSALIRYLQGLHLRLKGDNQLSLDAFLRAATVDPTNPAYAAELGTAYQLIGESQLAEDWLRQAVTLSDNDPRFQQLLDQFLSP